MNAAAPITNLTEKLRLRVEDFELLESKGAFEPYSKAELIDGDIYIVNAQFARHGLTKSRLLFALMARLQDVGSDLDVYSEVSLRVAPDSMPEPDLFVAPRQGFGPVAVGGVLLVIEVSDTTLVTDLGRKAALFAAGGIPEYWVVDVNEQRVLRHADPTIKEYAVQSVVPFGGPLESVAIDGLVISTTALIL